MNDMTLPSSELLKAIPNVEDVVVPRAQPYASRGILGGVPLLALAGGAAYFGWPDVVAYLFGLGGFFAVV
ncbi:MAG TPA: hypothetical protein VFH22_07140, partial [Rhodocyclaceae bacterium]|nr:hypothetical protein [Rhodocyclaceae bacterium]